MLQRPEQPNISQPPHLQKGSTFHISPLPSSVQTGRQTESNPLMSYYSAVEAIVGVKPPELIAVKVSKAFVGRKSSLAYFGCSRVTMATRAELDRRAHKGETVVPGGTGGHSLEAQEHLAQGRHKGGETRAHQLGHEGFVEMGKKGGLASHGADPYQAAIKQGVEIDEHKFMNETSIEKLDRRAREGETVVPGGTGGHSLEAQKHLAEGRHKGGVNSHLGDEGHAAVDKKAGLV